MDRSVIFPCHLSKVPAWNSLAKGNRGNTFYIKKNLKKLSCHLWKLALTEVRGPLCLPRNLPSAASSEPFTQSCLHCLSWCRTLQREKLSSTSSCGTCHPLEEEQMFLSGPYWLWASQREDGVNKTLLQVLSWNGYFIPKLKPVAHGKTLICLVD